MIFESMDFVLTTIIWRKNIYGGIEIVSYVVLEVKESF